MKIILEKPEMGIYIISRTIFLLGCFIIYLSKFYRD